MQSLPQLSMLERDISNHGSGTTLKLILLRTDITSLRRRVLYAIAAARGPVWFGRSLSSLRDFAMNASATEQDPDQACDHAVGDVSLSASVFAKVESKAAVDHA